jgi:Ca2+-binding RTX toxin-like protein
VIKLASDLIVENNEAFRLSLLSSSDPTQRILTPSVDAVIINDDVAGDAADVIQTGSGSDFIEAGGGDDLIEAGDGADMVYAGSGHDTIHAQGGADAIYGGLGDDVIWLTADNVAHFDGVVEQATSFVDGGFGVDAIALDGEGINLDLIALVLSGQVRSIEKFDLSGTGSNTLEISFEALSTSDADAGADGITELLVDGDANDRVILTDYRDWSRAGYADGYAVWNHLQGTARLVINLELDQTWV